MIDETTKPPRGKTFVIDGETFTSAMRVALDNLTVDWRTVIQLQTNTRTLESLHQRGLVEKRAEPAIYSRSHQHVVDVPVASGGGRLMRFRRYEAMSVKG